MGPRACRVQAHEHGSEMKIEIFVHQLANALATSVHVAVSNGAFFGL